MIKTNHNIFQLFSFLRATMIILLVGFFVSGSGGRAEIYTDRGKDAVSGYDTVAYFTKNSPVKGKKEFSHNWKGAVWYFASDENRKLFVANPEKYAPQYGGYCALAVSKNSIASADPRQWGIHKGRLYLNYNSEAQKLWLRSLTPNIKNADDNWPNVLGNW